MTDLDRFLCVCHGEQPDYVPIFGFAGAPGLSGGVLRQLHRRLVAQGMPDWVDGSVSLSEGYTLDTWHGYWGTTAPIYADFFPADAGGPGFKVETCVEDDWVTISSETGAVTRQPVDNDEIYFMPHYVSYDVRDRASWEFYRDRTTPGPAWSSERIDEAARKFDNRDRPLAVGAGSTWGWLRGLMGPEMACTILHDDPALAHDILDYQTWIRRTYVFPMIERLRPEIIATGEDMCYNHGLLISPRHFREFCAPAYREIGDVARDCGVTMVAVDTDGNFMELVPLLDECGVNAIFPAEAKAGNDLFALRERHPDFLLMGWLEKECVNEGMEHLIEPEVLGKVPRLLASGRYFPNLEHAPQPMATFDNFRRFMTLLHDVTNNPEGTFPRLRP